MKEARLSRLELAGEERAALPEGALPWECFKDPETRRVYWVNDNVAQCLWEGGGAWSPFVYAGRKWWSNNADPASWFYADTGTTS